MRFIFPKPPGVQQNPIWTGRNFQVDLGNAHILEYNKNSAGWDASLTEFHEREAESGNLYIDRASRSHAVYELKKCLTNDQSVILEIGSSSGYLLREIKKTYPTLFLIGSDCVIEPLEKIAQTYPDIPLMEFDLVSCPLPDNSVDIVIALNVLEHIEDDKCGLTQIYRILKPGGYAIIEVPANSTLYDFYDEQLKHFRRYDLSDLYDKVKTSKFQVVRSSYLGFTIYPIFKLVKNWNKRKSIPSHVQKRTQMKNFIQFGGSIFNYLMNIVMYLELNAGKFLRYPWGIRCLLTLKKDQ
jgi:ubiquinone/menaquinone biosynthesis C-methylase UbiE